MRLASITITNMAGFASFETKLPSVALIQGKNGQGKSSLLDSIRYAFGRGHDEDMIHGDEKEGEILIELDNGAAVKCKASRERNETVRSWRAPGSKRFVVSREQIDAMANAISYDPVAFLELPEEKQVETLLRVMPMDCSDQEIKDALGGADISVPTGGTALDRIAKLRKECYDRRRDWNVSADAKEKHAAELEKTLPPAAPEGHDWTEVVERLESQKSELETERQKRVGQLRKEFEADKEKAQDEYEQALRAAGDALNKKIEQIRVQANAKADQIGADVNSRLTTVVAELGTAKVRARNQAQAEGTRKSLELAKKDAEQNRAFSKVLTEAIDRLDALKETVASRLPIKDVLIQDGRILRNENGKLIPFNRWNTEAKIRFCLRIAVLAHGEAGFVVLDDAEHFDSEKRTALLNTAQKYAESTGMQFLIASVSDHPLTVSSPAGD